MRLHSAVAVDFVYFDCCCYSSSLLLLAISSVFLSGWCPIRVMLGAREVKNNNLQFIRWCFLCRLRLAVNEIFPRIISTFSYENAKILKSSYCQPIKISLNLTFLFSLTILSHSTPPYSLLKLCKEIPIKMALI